MKKAKFAGTYIIQNEQILLVQESHKEAYGSWSLPLGHVEENETVEECAARETKEETGYSVILGNSKELIINGKDFKSTTNFNDYQINLTIFESKIKGGVLNKGDDLLDAKWFPLNDLNKLSLRGDWLKFFIRS